MTIARHTVFVLAALLATQSHAADLPKRKSGLWEMKTLMAGLPPQGPMQMCVDQASDNLMQERAKEKVNCPVMEVSHSAGKVLIHTICKQDGTTATSDAVITGDFENNYRNEMSITYTPPQHGMSSLKMTQEARWLGPCKAGQKPGDIMMPGRPAMNMQEMMKKR
jgi:hypothetical protein